MTMLSPWFVGMVETRRSIGLPRDLHLDAAVLREAFLGDAHRAGHDLEPADDGGLQAFRRRLHFLEDAIDAKADAEFLLERLEVNVARAEAMRLDQEHRDHPDDRRVGFVAGIELSALGDLDSKIERRRPSRCSCRMSEASSAVP